MNRVQNEFNVLSMVPMDLRHLIPGFVERREKEILELSGLLARQDFAAIKALAHKLKGTGAGYGFQSISDLGHALETSANSQDVPQMKATIQHLCQVITTVKKALLEQRGEWQ